jgi:hypothetical protein
MIRIDDRTVAIDKTTAAAVLGHAAGKKSTRESLRGLSCDPVTGILAATDGHRLALIWCDGEPYGGARIERRAPWVAREAWEIAIRACPAGGRIEVRRLFADASSTGTVALRAVDRRGNGVLPWTEPEAQERDGGNWPDVRGIVAAWGDETGEGPERGAARRGGISPEYLAAGAELLATLPAGSDAIAIHVPPAWLDPWILRSPSGMVLIAAARIK